MASTAPGDLCHRHGPVGGLRDSLSAHHVTPQAAASQATHNINKVVPGVSPVDGASLPSMNPLATLEDVVALAEPAPTIASMASTPSTAAAGLAAIQSSTAAHLTASQLGELELARTRAARAAAGRRQQLKRQRQNERVQQNKRASRRQASAGVAAVTAAVAAAHSEDPDNEEEQQQHSDEQETSDGDHDAVQDARKLKRLLRNRVSAQQARERKKAQVAGLEQQLKEAHQSLSQLQATLRESQNQNEALRRIIRNMHAGQGQALVEHTSPPQPQLQPLASAPNKPVTPPATTAMMAADAESPAVNAGDGVFGVRAAAAVAVAVASDEMATTPVSCAALARVQQQHTTALSKALPSTTYQSGVATAAVGTTRKGDDNKTASGRGLAALPVATQSPTFAPSRLPNTCPPPVNHTVPTFKPSTHARDTLNTPTAAVDAAATAAATADNARISLTEADSFGSGLDNILASAKFRSASPFNSVLAMGLLVDDVQQSCDDAQQSCDDGVLGKMKHAPSEAANVEAANVMGRNGALHTQCCGVAPKPGGFPQAAAQSPQQSVNIMCGGFGGGGGRGGPRDHGWKKPALFDLELEDLMDVDEEADGLVVPQAPPFANLESFCPSLTLAHQLLERRGSTGGEST